MNELPVEEQETLARLLSVGDMDTVKARVARLHDNGWSYREIAPYVKVTHATVAKWAAAEPRGHAPTSPKVLITAGDRTVRWDTHVPIEQADRMAYLAPIARKVTAHSSETSEAFLAGVELDELIKSNLDRFVPVTEIAKIIGITHRAVRARLERRYG